MAKSEHEPRQISAKQLIALINDACQKRQRISSISGEIGERVKHACDNANLNKKAFSLAVQVARMPEDRRAAFLAAFPLYIDMMREEGMFGDEHVGDLADMAGDNDAADESDPEAEAGEANAALLSKGIKPLGEDEPGPDATYRLTH